MPTDTPTPGRIQVTSGLRKLAVLEAAPQAVFLVFVLSFGLAVRHVGS